jgi:cytoskeletal protein CcmA (bactofilin family)
MNGDAGRAASGPGGERLGAAVGQREDAPPLVPRDGFFEGQVAVVGDTRIEGSVQGSLRGPGRLVLSPGARVEGIVECDRVDVEGQMIGPIRAGRLARFGPGAEIEGDVEAPAIEMADDATWNGRARIGR